MQRGGDVERFGERAGRVLRLVDADDHRQWLAGPLGDRLPPDHDWAVRPIHGPHGLPAQHAMVRRTSAYHHKPCRLGCVRQGFRYRTLEDRPANREVRMRRPHGRLRRGEHRVAVRVLVDFGGWDGAEEMPVQIGDRVQQRQRQRVPGGKLRGPLGGAERSVRSIDTHDNGRLVGFGSHAWTLFGIGPKGAKEPRQNRVGF